MIFVTGGSGLLGTHLLYELVQHSEPVRALYRNESKLKQVQAVFNFYSPDKGDELFDKIEWVKGDILDLPSLEEHMEGVQKVYHSAALVSFHPKDFNDLIKINSEGTENIVNICLAQGVKKLCYVSSTAAIGGVDEQFLSEQTKWKSDPSNSGYSISKYNAERAVWRAQEEGLTTVIVNPSVILGPGNWDESSLTIFRTVQKGIKRYPSGSNATVDARDVASIMYQLMESDIEDERFLCIGSNQSFKELMEVIADELNVSKPQQPVSRGTVNFVRRILGFFNWIVGKRSAITKETVNSLYSNKTYDNSKVKNALQFEFRDLQEQVKNAVAGRIQL